MNQPNNLVKYLHTLHFHTYIHICRCISVVNISIFTSNMNAKKHCSCCMFSLITFSICLFLSPTTDEWALMMNLKGAEDVNSVMFSSNGKKAGDE